MARVCLITVFCLIIGIAPLQAGGINWDETPLVYGADALRATARYSFKDAGSTSDGEVRARMFTQEYGIDYAPNSKVNLGLTIPYHNNLRQQFVGGQLRSKPFVGLGDMTLALRQRVSHVQDDELLLQHIAIYGLKLPTGRSNRLDPNGLRAAPSDQTGTGKPGLVLGYAMTRETPDQIIWAGVEYRHELGGNFHRGDMVRANLTYTHTFKRPVEASDFNVRMAMGVYGEYNGGDRVGAGVKTRGNHIMGFSVTPMLAKGRSQIRAGVMVPFSRRGPKDQVGYRYEVRVGLETLF